jgi:phosphate/sulfate permease
MDVYLLIVILLGILAITDPVVGVSNDAVNFLNSAIGSKVASLKTILWIAISGVLIGSLFSSGIMEIARTGIFFPEKFTLDKLLFIFLSVMLTDIVLLDIFNTLGLPTSTTISIVFELLGASLMAGILFSIEKNEPAGKILSYINGSSLGIIIAGIFLSIIIAFSLGIIIQYLCRLIFSFDYEKKMEKWV